MLPVPLYQLQCGTNSYDWGKIGADSAAARFAAATEQSEFKIEPHKPYAELWMGTHPSNPSKDVATGRTLLELVTENQALLSKPVAERYGQKLPFLFKVLSIQKALSIQAHPDKKLAERLHKEDPKNYPDDNHKPEMTIAVTPFDGFCGFRPLDQIASFLIHVPELRSLVGEEEADKFIKAVSSTADSTDPDVVSKNKAALKSLFTALMTSEDSRIKELASSLLLVRLDSQFPQDIGLFCVFFLNYITLSPGEAIFLRANDPHAYLSGDIIECMAASDNVVRAGFTPKFKDVKNLVEMLTYSYAPIEAQKMKPVPWEKGDGNGTSILYDPPIEEFAVVKTELPAGGGETFKPVEGPSVVIFTEGSGSIAVGPKKETVVKGLVFFVGATAELEIEAGDEGVVAFRAFCELN
ncbi:mannose-6-phosphate isomerase [Wilcoxina mikolae CBS 423.85]|nr:mannose-6-phosphate isomerase [Wilcoxina mikolae CBS 423.85]